MVTQSKDDLMANPCLPCVLYLQIQSNLAQRRQGVLFEFGSVLGGATFRERARQEPILRGILPIRWAGEPTQVYRPQQSGWIAALR